MEPSDHSVPYMLKPSNLFEALPKDYYDTAFLDRIHAYLPGWEVQKLRKEMFTSDKENCIWSPTTTKTT